MAEEVLPVFGGASPTGFLSSSGGDGGSSTPPPPPSHEPTSNGLVVVLSRVEGFTQKGLLSEPFYFQCAPLETMPRDMAWQWTDYLTLGTGYHSQPNAPNLESWSFDTLMVDDDWGLWFTQTKKRDLLGMVRELKKLGDSMTPFQLQFGNPQLWGEWDVVSGATLRGLHVEERAGEPDSRYLTVSFMEFPDAPTHKPVPADPTKSKKKTTDERYLAVLDSAKLPTHRDTMAELAKHYYGKVSDWRMIAKASGLTKYGPNTNLRTTAGKQKPPVKIKVPKPPKPKKRPQSGK